MQIFFWIILILIFYVYIGYPISIFLLSKIIYKKVNKSEYYPTVSLIIAAYNEEKVIEQKIVNSLELDYTSDKLEILVFSDGSTDQTDNIVKKYENKGIKLFRYEGRKGKTYCQNETVKRSSGEVIVFSDANSIYDGQAIKELVFNFHDNNIGVVCGELRYQKNNISQEGLYWKIEKKMKKSESLFGSCLGANGSIYAIRRDLYEELPENAISDFVEPFYIFRKGFRVVYEEKAFCMEEVGENKIEFNRKRRIILRSLNSLRLIKDFFNIFKYGFYSVQFWSHKILRWFVPIFFLILFFSNLFLLDVFLYKIIFFLQILFYFFALLGKKNKNTIFSVPYYFCLINFVSLLALVDFFRGRGQNIWRVER